MVREFDAWLATAPLLVIAVAALAAMVAAALAGFALRARMSGSGSGEEGQAEGYVVSAVLGLLALLLAFTFSLAAERFEQRRLLVLDEANAIGTTWLRAQLLDAPHRQRLSALLARYADSRIELAEATEPDRLRPLLATNDQILTDLWAATSGAADDMRSLGLTVPFLSTMNEMIDLDAKRKAARSAHVPGEIFEVLMIYLLTASAVLGYALAGRGRVAAGCLLGLMALSFALILDIDRPTGGGIREEQGPMRALRASMAAQSGAVFDRWRSPGPAAAPKGG